ncbi:MAG: FecR family protein [Planctomycetota bacterium]
MMTASEFQLLERYLDGTLEPRDQESLQSLLRRSAEARSTLRTLATIDFGLQDLSEGDPSPSLGTDAKIAEIDLAARRTSAFPEAKRLLLIAAALLAVATAGWLIRREEDQALPTPDSSSSPMIAKVIGLGGVVLWTGDGGRVTSDLKIGTQLTGGTIEAASPTSWAELEFDDGSTVVVSGDSRLTFSDFGQKILYLKRGNVVSSVKPQSAERPMLVHTRTATLEVLGTEFNVHADVDATALNVTEGKVRLKRLIDGQTVDVPANERVVATSQAKLLSSPIPSLVSRWTSQLDQRSNQVLGKWMPKTAGQPARLRTIPYQHTTAQGDRIMVFAAGILVSAADGGRVYLHSDSQIRVQGRAQRATAAAFGVTVHRPGSRQREDFMIFRQLLTPDTDGSFDVTVAAKDLRLESSFTTGHQDSPATPVDAIVDSFFCSTLTDAPVLEIVSVAVFRPTPNSDNARSNR